MLHSNRTVRDRLEHILARLEARCEDERVFVGLYPASARAEADAADERFRQGNSLGPLDGRIISIKDLFDVAGEPTLAGSIIHRTSLAALKDAIVVERLRAAGAVIIGKTHMTEFAFTAVGLNPHYPVPGNAVDARLIPGGSSSGAAVSAAEGTCEIAIGSDTGGSVRIPAALNGLVGFKPTARRIPLEGAFPLAPSLDSIGPLARTVEDCALADAVMSGAMPVMLEPRTLSGLRIGVPRGCLFEELSSEVEVAFEIALQQLSQAGALIGNCVIDDLLQALSQATAIGSIAGIEASRIHCDWLMDEEAPVDIRVKSTLKRRLQVPDSAYQDLMTKRKDLIRAMDLRLEPFDMLVLPTTPIQAVEIATVMQDESIYRQTEDLLLRNTQVANQFDLTAITLPLPGTSLPAGFMLMGRGGTDTKILGTAASIEMLFAHR